MSRHGPKGENLPACMYWKNGAYWLVRRRKWTRLGATYRSAMLVYTRMMSPAHGAMDRLVEDALPLILHGRAPSTQRQYRQAARVVLDMLRDFEPAQVTHADIVTMRDELRRTPNMANRVLTVAKLIFNFAADRAIVPTNPAASVTPLPERKRGRYLSDAEVTAIRANAGDRLRIIIDLLYLTGQRVADVLAIRRADLSDDGISFRQGKTGIRRTIAWNDDLRATVEAAKALSGTVAALTLLRGRWGGPVDYKSVQEQWTRACRLAGVADARLHDLRAKAATDAKRLGLDPTALLGHATPAMTLRYLRGKESPVVQGPSVRYLTDRLPK